jgi:aminoglycoside 6-adenylyltransferase
LNGSRANPIAKKDKFQDFDIVFIVRDIDSFIKDPDWVDIFGERLIMQVPDNMKLGDNFQIQSFSFAYLMLFEDGNRIDLTLFPIEKFKTKFQLDSLAKVLLDKDALFNNLKVSSDKDYWIKRPTEKDFLDHCNEFWWVSTYVAKGLVRKEITCAKAMMDGPVRAMFMKVLEWHIGIKTNFSVSFGKDGRFIQQYVTHEMYKKILSTYSDFEIEPIWDSLFMMTSLFLELSNEVQEHFNFQPNDEESSKVISYLHKIRYSF